MYKLRPHYKEIPVTILQRNDLDKETARRLPSTVSRVAYISPPSPFVDVITYIRSLSTTFQIQIKR